MSRSVVIIGSGLGGLLCGAILAKRGFGVTILEKESCAGGCLRMFRRGGVDFETGFHYVGGLGDDSAVRHLLDYLDVTSRLNLELSDTCFDELVAGGKHYRMMHSRKAFVESLSEQFPSERDNIRRYVDDLYAISERVPLFNLSLPDSNAIFGMGGGTLQSIGDFIDSHTANEELRRVLAWNNSLYGSGPEATPVELAAMITRLYIDGSARFVGGSGQLADALIDIVRSRGGEVLTDVEVVSAHMSGSTIDCLVDSAGREYRAENYISTIHPSCLMRILPEGALPRAFVRRVEAIPNSTSLFTLFVKLRPESVPYMKSTLYYLRNLKDVWTTCDATRSDFPKGMLIITPPDRTNQQWAERMIVHCVMEWKEVAKWSDSRLGDRPEEYESVKKYYSDAILTRLNEIFPNFRDKIQMCFSASPLTLRDYMSLPQGAIYGTVHDCRHPLDSLLSTRTKIDNLLLSGQSVRFHGMCGVPMTALETCLRLTGPDLLDEIRNTRNRTK